MSDKADQARERLDDLIRTQRATLYIESLRGSESIRAASDDYSPRDRDNELLYALVSHVPEQDTPNVARTTFITRSLSEALGGLDGSDLAEGETRQVRAGGVALAIRRTKDEAVEDAPWLKTGEERFAYDGQSLAEIAADDAERFPTGGRLVPDDVRVQAIPRMPFYAKPRAIDGIDMSYDIEAVLRTAEDDKRVTTYDMDSLEDLAAAAWMQTNPTAWQHHARGRWGDLADPNPRAFIEQRAEIAWSRFTQPEVQAWGRFTKLDVLRAYASAIVDHVQKSAIPDPLEDGAGRHMPIPPAWADGHMDAARRAVLLGDHLVFGQEMLPAGIEPAIEKPATPTTQTRDHEEPTRFSQAPETPTQARGSQPAIRPDLAVYDRALAAAFYSRRLEREHIEHYKTRSDTLDHAKLNTYRAVSAVTRSPGFYEAGHAVDTDEGLLMQNAWDGDYEVLTRRLDQVRQAAAKRPQAIQLGEEAVEDTEVSATVDRVLANLAEGEYLYKPTPREIKTAYQGTDHHWTEWDHQNNEMVTLRSLPHDEAITALMFVKASSQFTNWARTLRENGGNDQAASIMHETASNLRSGVRAVIATREGTSPTSKERMVRQLADYVDSRKLAVRNRINETSEDSYVTRNALRDEINFLSTLSAKIRKADKTGIVDLSTTYTDYSDFMDEAEFHQDATNYGLEYVPPAGQEQGKHEARIRQVRYVLDVLVEAGMEVRTDFTVVTEPENFIAPDPSEYEDELEQANDGPEI